MNQRVKNFFATLCIALILIGSSGCATLTSTAYQVDTSTAEEMSSDDSMSDDDTASVPPATYIDDIYSEKYGKKEHAFANNGEVSLLVRIIAYVAGFAIGFTLAGG